VKVRALVVDGCNRSWPEPALTSFSANCNRKWMVNKAQRRKALPADYWKWLPGGDKPLTRKTFSPATSIPSPLLSLIGLPFFKTRVPSTLQTVPSASVMSFVRGIILPLVIIIMRPSFIKTQSPMGWPLLSTILPFCIVHSITAFLVFAQTGGWIANKVRLRIAANLPTRDKMNRPPRKRRPPLF